MGLKGILYSAAACAAVVASGYAGFNAALDRDYRIQKNEGQISLYSRSLDKALPITSTEKTFYLGNSDHNLNGVKELGKKEGQESMKPKIEGLEGQVQQYQGQLDKLKIMSNLENLGLFMKNAWYNAKDNALNRQPSQ